VWVLMSAEKEVQWVEANAESLPLESNSMDAYTIVRLEIHEVFANIHTIGVWHS
jgi:ubiquinone/menaquinone biosynthesis C-methylase UbiE